MQELRGLFTHYANCNPMWKTLAQPIDAILGYPDVSSMWVRCDDVELRTSFRNMILSLRHLTGTPDDWGNSFAGAILDILPHHIRLSGPEPREKVFWFSGDATLARVSCINWHTAVFTLLPVSDLVDPFSPRPQQSIIIADIELLANELAIVLWGFTGEGIIQIAVSGSLNAAGWANWEKAKRWISLKLLETLRHG